MEQMQKVFYSSPKHLEGKVNSAEIEIEFAENDKREYEKEFMPKGIHQR